MRDITFLVVLVMGLAILLIWGAKIPAAIEFVKGTKDFTGIMKFIVDNINEITLELQKAMDEISSINPEDYASEAKYKQILICKAIIIIRDCAKEHDFKMNLSDEALEEIANMIALSIVKREILLEDKPAVITEEKATSTVDIGDNIKEFYNE